MWNLQKVFCSIVWSTFFVLFFVVHIFSYITFIYHICYPYSVNLCHTSWWFNHKIHKVYVIFIHVYLIASRHVLLALLYACRQVHSQFKLFVICTDRNILSVFLSACFWWIMFRDNEVCFIWIFFYVKWNLTIVNSNRKVFVIYSIFIYPSAEALWDIVMRACMCRHQLYSVGSTRTWPRVFIYSCLSCKSIIILII